MCSSDLPFWAWAAGGWFSVFPTTLWAFALLSAVNAAIGLLGTYALAGSFLERDHRLSAVTLLLLTPFYTLLAFKYNANTIFLSLWPWTAFFLVRSIENKDARYAVGFGVLAALDMLSKYYAVLLLATCLWAALLHPQRERYFRSKAPYLAVGAGLLLLTPHFLWLFNTGFLPFAYFESEAGNSLRYALMQVGNVFLQSVLPQLTIPIAMFAGRAEMRMVSVHIPWADARFRVLLVLALAPIFLTLVTAVMFRVKLTSNTTAAIFCLTPALFLAAQTPIDASLRRRFLRWSCLLSLASLLASPALAYGHALKWFGGTPNINQPCEELADAVTQEWHQFAGAKLNIVAGTEVYADGVTFYSVDHPSSFIAFDTRKAPWVNPDRIRREGMLIVCASSDTNCHASAASFDASNVKKVTLTLQHHYFQIAGKPAQFNLYLVPPKRDR